MPVPFVPAPNCLQVSLIYTTNGGHAENVYHVQGDAIIQDLTATAHRIMDVFAAWDSAHLAGGRVVGHDLVLVTARDIGQQHGPSWERTTASAGALAGSSALPDGVTIAVKWTTGRSGRSYRGRTYHIGLAASQCTGDVLTQAAAGGLLLAYQALIPAVKGSGWTAAGDTGAHLAVISKRQNKVYLPSAVSTEITGAAFADLNLDSQRRRLAGRGT